MELEYVRKDLYEAEVEKYKKWRDMAGKLENALRENMSCINDWGQCEDVTSYGIEAREEYAQLLNDTP